MSRIAEIRLPSPFSTTAITVGDEIGNKDTSNKITIFVSIHVTIAEAVMRKLS